MGVATTRRCQSYNDMHLLFVAFSGPGKWFVSHVRQAMCVDCRNRRVLPKKYAMCHCLESINSCDWCCFSHATGSSTLVVLWSWDEPGCRWTPRYSATGNIMTHQCQCQSTTCLGKPPGNCTGAFILAFIQRPLRHCVESILRGTILG